MRIDYDKHWAGIEKEQLVFASKDIIVVIDKELDVDWETTEEWDNVGPADRAKHHAIVSQATKIEVTPYSGFRKDEIIKFKRLLGEALAQSFQNEYENAQELLASAENYVKARNKEKARLWSLSSSFFTATVIVILLAIIMAFYDDGTGNEFGISGELMLLSLFFGCIGGLFSTILRIGGSKGSTASSASGKTVHYFEGAARIIAGCLGGVLAMIAVKAGLFLSLFADTDNSMWGIILISFVAGVSEVLAPSIIAHVESASSKDRN